MPCPYLCPHFPFHMSKQVLTSTSSSPIFFIQCQEPTTNDDYSSDSTLSNSKSNNQRSLTSTPMPHITDSSSQQATANASSSTAAQNSSGVSNSTESVTPTSSLASMIKVGYARPTLTHSARSAANSQKKNKSLSLSLFILNSRNWVENF